MAVRPLLPFLFFVLSGTVLCQDSTLASRSYSESVDTANPELLQLLRLAERHVQVESQDSASYYHDRLLASLDTTPWNVALGREMMAYADRLMHHGRTRWARDLYLAMRGDLGTEDSLSRSLNFALGWSQTVLGDFEPAASTYRQMLQDNGVPSVRYHAKVLQAYCYLNQGKVDSARVLIDEASSLGEVSSSGMLAGCEAIIHLYAGDTSAAVLSSERALVVAKREDEKELQTGLYRWFAAALLGLGLKEEALLVTDSALMTRTPLTPRIESVEIYRIRADVFKALGRFEEALLDLETYDQQRDSLLGSLKGIPTADLQQIAIENATLAKNLARVERDVVGQRNWIIVLVFTLFASLFFSVRYLRTLQKSKWAYTKLQESNRKVVTQSKEIALAQEEIIKSEKMAFLGRVFAGVGHELNTPIAAVKANLQLIEDAQMQEIRKLKELANVFTPHILEVMTDLIIASYQAQQNPLSTIKQRALKKTLRSYFQDELDGDPMDFADMFDDLKVYDGLKRFESVYRHEKGVDILELVMFISHRTRSIFTAMEALQRADKILFSLKSYSFKNLQDEKVEFDLIRNINNIITLHQNKLKNVTVYKQFEESVEIEGYPDELTQVWTNLISNATYANKYRGNLWIRVKQYEDKVQVDIEDSGGGIDPKVKERIFEPFETTKPEGEGTGLGLSITKRVIDKHKGTITVDNTATGALFSVTLPKSLP